MKKSVFFILFGLTITAAQAQGISDALQYAQENVNGTARFRAMSGAFGALGGDFSSLTVNPAGSAVFNNNQVGITLTNYNIRNTSKYYGTEGAVNNSTFDLNQAAGIFVFNNTSETSGWKKFVIAVNYENSNNFDNSIFTAGNNPNHSIADYFLSYSNPNPVIGQSGIPLNALQNSGRQDLTYQYMQALIGFQTGIIKPNNPTAPNNDIYNSNVPAGGNYYQENYIESSGYNGKLVFNAGAQYKDQFYFGLNINSHFTDYVRSTNFYEDNINSTTNGVRSLVFSNDLHTYGSGFSFQLGAIAKITPAFRAGLAYQSPTWYTLNDEVIGQAGSSGFFTEGSTSLSERYSNTSFTVVFDPYKLQTPGKWTGSLAYVFSKSGLISVDFGIKDYGNMRYRSVGFSDVNARMGNVLDYAPEFRIGAEKRIKQWSLRAGYRFEQSPYKNGTMIGDLYSGSAGFGYNFGYTKLDLSYTYAQRKSQLAAFSQGFTDTANIKSINNNISLTLLFDL